MILHGDMYYTGQILAGDKISCYRFCSDTVHCTVNAGTTPWWCSWCGNCKMILHRDMYYTGWILDGDEILCMDSVMVQFTVLWTLVLHPGGEVVKTEKFIINFWKIWIWLRFHKIHQCISDVLKCKIWFCLWFHLQFC